jgi:hypothetical protein
MASLDDIANVTITLASAGVSAADFGSAIIVGPHMAFSERVREYKSVAAATADALPPALLGAVTTFFSQSPRPKRVKVGRREVSAAIINVSEVVNSATYTITVAGTVYNFTSAASATAASIVTGLAAAITADAAKKVTATVIGSTLQLVWISQAAIGNVALGARLSWGAISPSASGTAVADDLTAIAAYDNAWYGLAMVERVQATQLAASAWVEPRTKLFCTASNEAGLLTSGTTDLGALVKALGYNRTTVWYHGAAATQYLDAALLGRMATLQPGSETWVLKTLVGVTADGLTDSQQALLLGKNANGFLTYTADISQTAGGKVASGEWIDIIRFRDWLESTIQADMVTLLKGLPKLPFTDPGIQLASSVLRKSLEKGVKAGGIAPPELDADGKNVPSFTITAPLSTSLTPSQKASRTLGLTFSARLAGAIHLVEITGTLAYTL